MLPVKSPTLKTLKTQSGGGKKKKTSAKEKKGGEGRERGGLRSPGWQNLHVIADNCQQLILSASLHIGSALTPPARSWLFLNVPSIKRRDAGQRGRAVRAVQHISGDPTAATRQGRRVFQLRSLFVKEW